MSQSSTSNESSNQQYRDSLSAKKVQLVCRVGKIFAQKFSAAEELTEKMNNLAESGKEAILMAIELDSEEERKQRNESGSAFLKDLVREYEKYLQNSGLQIWDKNSEEAKDARRICRQNPDQLCLDLEGKSEEEFVNIAICLVFQAISSTIKFSDEKRGGGDFPKRRNMQNRDGKKPFDRGFSGRRDDRREGGERNGSWNDGRGGLRARKSSQRGEDRNFGGGERRERSFDKREGGERKFEGRREGNFEERGERKSHYNRSGERNFSRDNSGERRNGENRSFSDRRRSDDRGNFGGREGGERNSRPRSEGGERSFESRDRKPFRDREEKGEKRDFGGERKWNSDRKREGGFGDKKFGRRNDGGAKRRPSGGGFGGKRRDDF